jgi:hypothetical protein
VGKGGAAAPPSSSGPILLSPESLEQIKALFDSQFDVKFDAKYGPLVEQITAVNQTAVQSLTVATAAEAIAQGVQQQLYSEKYADPNMRQRNKRISISPLDLEVDRQQQGRQALTLAARKAVERVLGSSIKSEPQDYWDLFDIEVIPCKKGSKQQGRFVVIFSVQKSEDAKLIMLNRKELKQGGRELVTRVWLTKQEESNKKKVMAHPGWKEARDIIMAKPLLTPGYYLGWDLDRGFTVIAGQRTVWHADALQQPAGQGGAGAGPSSGAQPMQQ